MKLNQSLPVEQVVEKLDALFFRLRATSPDRPLQVRIVAPKIGLDYAFPFDSTRQPYHIASIGKVFAAVLIQKLAASGALRLEDPITRFFSARELEGLFTWRGVDYAAQVTVEQLMGHTSGIADYFEGKTRGVRPFTAEILANPGKRWTPLELVEFSRAHQSAVGIPGKVFNYSDTGYILLGLLIEKISGKSYDRNLEDEIFQPLDMKDSYLMFSESAASLPRPAIEKIWFEEVEVSGYESLSSDWAGGGIISTTADLLRFNQALRSGGLVNAEALTRMDVCRHRFRPGIHYGLGMMELRFGEFFFLLGGLPRAKGHIGILATHMFFDPIQEAHIVLNFGSTRRMVESFRALIEIETLLKKAAPR